MHDGGEGQQLFEDGVEGIHWKQDGDHVSLLPNPENPKELLPNVMMPAYCHLSPLKDSTKSIKFDDRVNVSDDILKKDGVQQVPQPISKKLSKITQDLIKLKAKTIASIVMGKTTIDEGLKTYASEAKNLGIDEVLKEMNDAK